MAEINDNLRIASKADLNALTAEDVHARPDTWMPTASDVGAFPAKIQLKDVNIADVLSNYGVGFFAVYNTDLSASGNLALGYPNEDGAFSLIVTSTINGYSGYIGNGTAYIAINRDSGNLYICVNRNNSFSAWKQAMFSDGSVAMSGDLKIKKAGRTANYPDSHLLLEQLSSGVTGMYNMTTNSIYTGLAVNPIYEEDTTTPKALFRVKNPNIDKWYELHHAGNKPSGSYTGNGSATKREINIGGIGKVLMIVQARNLTFVWNGGGVTLNPEVSGGTVLHTASEIKFVNDVLTIATDKPNVNYSTGVYDYYRF